MTHIFTKNIDVQTVNRREFRQSMIWNDEILQTGRSVFRSNFNGHLRVTQYIMRKTESRFGFFYHKLFNCTKMRRRVASSTNITF